MPEELTFAQRMRAKIRAEFCSDESPVDHSVNADDDVARKARLEECRKVAEAEKNRSKMFEAKPADSMTLASGVTMRLRNAGTENEAHYFEITDSIDDDHVGFSLDDDELAELADVFDPATDRSSLAIKGGYWVIVHESGDPGSAGSNVVRVSDKDIEGDEVFFDADDAMLEQMSRVVRDRVRTRELGKAHPDD